MKKNGFIATSLIYSLFLVFLAVLLAILNSYISTNTILTVYNENIQNRLNYDYIVPINKSLEINRGTSHIVKNDFTIKDGTTFLGCATCDSDECNKSVSYYQQRNYGAIENTNVLPIGSFLIKCSVSDSIGREWGSTVEIKIK